MALLDPVNRIRPSPFAEPKGEKRKARPDGTAPDLVGERGRERIEALLDVPASVNQFLEENRIELDLSKGRL
jgi:hypothetical protein